MPFVIRSLLLSLFWGCVHLATYAETSDQTCDATAQKPCLVLDTPLSIQTVKHWRSGLEISTSAQANSEDIIPIWISGSSMPAAQAWSLIVSSIQNQAPVAKDKIYVVDLRQESHGYVNGKAITLCDRYNWLNLGKHREEVVFLERLWLDTLASIAKLTHVLDSKQFDDKAFDQGETIDVESIASEETIVKEQGMQYLRIPVTDHRSPLDEEVETFVNLVSSLPKDAWVHVHCRGGKGRTTTFMALFDMLKNADNLSFEEIIARQKSIPPYYNLSLVDRANADLKPHYIARFLFLKDFYRYAQDRLAGNKMSWQEWRAIYGLQGFNK